MRTITFLSGMFFTLQSFAQQYIPFPIQANWYQLDEFQTNPSDYRAINTLFSMNGGDTIINTIPYHKVYKTQYGIITYIGGIREEKALKEVYFYGSTDATEHLLYKFGLSIGDSLQVRAYNNDKPISVLAIDSVAVLSGYRKRYLMSTPTAFLRDYWIEGIGSTKGLFYTRDGSEFENQATLLCFETNGVLQYKNPRATNSCSTYTNDLQKVNITVYPNPASDKLYFKLNGMNLNSVTLKIYDILGTIILNQKMMIFDENQPIIIENLTNGIYLYEISSDNGTTTGKLMIEKP